jgi:hypothetical protein
MMSKGSAKKIAVATVAVAIVERIASTRPGDGWLEIRRAAQIAGLALMVAGALDL